jgi:NAD(P)-dependent dehydrogenase (short-subunit alcohol dehydrogenase family)
VTTEVIESWIAGYEGSPRSRNKLLIQMHGILGRAKKVYGLHANAAVEVEKFQQKASGDIQVFSPEEVWALVRAAASEQDAALFLTAAFTGLRMGELLADAPRQVIDRAVDRFGGVDVLVVNHAMSGLGRLNEVSTEQLDMAWVVNARAAVLLVQAFAAQHDDSRQDGRVLLFTSGQHLGPMADELPSRSARARCIR